MRGNYARKEYNRESNGCQDYIMGVRKGFNTKRDERECVVLIHAEVTVPAFSAFFMLPVCSAFMCSLEQEGWIRETERVLC